MSDAPAASQPSMFVRIVFDGAFEDDAMRTPLVHLVALANQNFTKNRYDLSAQLWQRAYERLLELDLRCTFAGAYLTTRWVKPCAPV